MPECTAFISNIGDEKNHRWWAVFASYAVRDEWWRAMSASPHAIFIERLNPTLYAQHATQRSLSNFFNIPELKHIAAMFRGRIHLTPMGGGINPTIPTLPPQEVTNRISEGWYHIRSISNHALCWHYDATENKIRASGDEPTQFRINVRNGATGEMILANEDRITLHMSSQLHVDIEQSGQMTAGAPVEFGFWELESGNFSLSEDASVVFVDAAKSSSRLIGWELWSDLSAPPPHCKPTPEHCGAENHDDIKSRNAALEARVMALMKEAASAQRKSQLAAAAAEIELAYVKGQFEIIKSKNVVLAQESAETKERLQAAEVARNVAQKELANVKRQLEVIACNNGVLVHEIIEAKEKLQATEQELTKSKQELRSSESARVQERADAQQKLQAAAAEAAAAQTELGVVKRKLDVMELANAGLDARLKSLEHEVAVAREKLQTLPIQRLADFLLCVHQPKATLHDLYKAAMLSLIEWNAGKTADAYRRILGIIIISQTPLADAAIAGLSGLDRESVIACRNTLQRLGAVIQWSEGQPARIMLPSFADYLTDQSASSSEPWFIDVNEHQRALTLACFRVMNEGLQFNMGDLKTSYLANENVPDLPAHVGAVIPQTMSYACQSWGHHLGQTTLGGPSILYLILPFFELKFLYWLEVMSLSGEMPLASRALISVMQHVENPTNKVYAFAQDGLKFVGAFAPALARSTPHIYLSCIPFAPRASLIKQQYTDTLKNILSIENGIDETWPVLQQVLEGHASSVKLVTFSPDGQRIASGSFDRTVQIWDAATGTLVGQPFTLAGYANSVYSMAFSPDSQRVVSCSHEMNIQIWDAMTGTLIAQPYMGNTGSVYSLAVSPDCQRIASGMKDKTVRIWDATTGDPVGRPFTGHTDHVNSVAFSSDSQRIVSGSDDKTIQICDAKTGARVAGPFKGHESSIVSVAFSPDSQRIVSGSSDNTVRIWDATTRALVGQPFVGNACYANSVAFSPDSQRIVSAWSDNTVQICDAKTGARVGRPFKGHTSETMSAAFSPDSQRVVSGSYDKTVRIWDALTAFEAHTASVNATSSSQQQHSNAHDGLGGHPHLENGWMVNSSGSLLFYVPHEHRKELWWPHGTVVISEKPTRLDLTRFVHGEDWVRCHI